MVCCLDGPFPGLDGFQSCGQDREPDREPGREPSHGQAHDLGRGEIRCRGGLPHRPELWDVGGRADRWRLDGRLWSC